MTRKAGKPPAKPPAKPRTPPKPPGKRQRAAMAKQRPKQQPQAAPPPAPPLPCCPNCGSSTGWEQDRAGTLRCTCKCTAILDDAGRITQATNPWGEPLELEHQSKSP